MTRPRPIKHCPATTCPKCGERAPCVDHIEVDIGIGIQTGEHSYCCPTHGEFGCTNYSPYEIVFRDEQPIDPDAARKAEEFERAIEDRNWRPAQSTSEGKNRSAKT